MAYDFEQWVEASIAERRYRWVRWTLAIGMAGLIVWALLIFAGTGPDASWPGLMRLIAIGGMLTMLVSPFNRAAWRTPKNRTPSYDERERMVLLRARAEAYGWLSAVLLLAVTWCAAGAPRGWPMPRTGGEWVSLVPPVALAIISLPILIAEWRTPFPPAAEQSL
jgi:hypothetical protein